MNLNVVNSRNSVKGATPPAHRDTENLRDRVNVVEQKVFEQSKVLSAIVKLYFRNPNHLGLSTILNYRPRPVTPLLSNTCHPPPLSKLTPFTTLYLPPSPIHLSSRNSKFLQRRRQLLTDAIEVLRHMDLLFLLSYFCVMSRREVSL